MNFPNIVLSLGSEIEGDLDFASFPGRSWDMVCFQANTQNLQ